MPFGSRYTRNVYSGFYFLSISAIIKCIQHYAIYFSFFYFYKRIHCLCARVNFCATVHHGKLCTDATSAVEPHW